MNVKDFYGSGRGDKLLFEQNYPKEIVDYLDKEKEVLLNISKDYKVIIEVGCMSGRGIDCILANKLKYIGVDIVNRYIEKGKELAIKKGLDRNSYEYFCIPAENLQALLKESLILKDVDKTQVLIYFPFNCFGNFNNVSLCINALKSIQYDFIIFTYQNSETALNSRYKYYKNCKYENIKIEHETNGIRFVSEDGLNTIAYSKEWLSNNIMFKEKEFEVIDFGSIGLAFYSKKILVKSLIL